MGSQLKDLINNSSLASQCNHRLNHFRERGRIYTVELKDKNLQTKVPKDGAPYLLPTVFLCVVEYYFK